MVNKNTFCNSPWFHLEIEQSGVYNFCSFTENAKINDQRIQDTSPVEFMNSQEFRQIRSDLLEGKSIANCDACYQAERHGKIFGRRKMLSRSAIFTEQFEASLLQSPHLEQFEYSLNNNGAAQTPIKFLKINLGSTCNAACVYCHPKFSTRLAQDFKKIGWHQELQELYTEAGGSVNFHSESNAWQKFLDAFNNDFKHVDFIQLLGGETLYEPKFYEFMDYLIQQNMSKNITLGITTNGSVWREDFPSYFNKFKAVSLGISVDCDHAINDYMRYPTKMSTVKNTVAKFKQLENVFMLLRPTPNVFSIGYLDTLVDYMMTTGMATETCQILTRPHSLQIQVLPASLRPWAIDKLETVLKKYNLNTRQDYTLLNTRTLEAHASNIANDIGSYINILKTEPILDSKEIIRELIALIRGFERIRNNSIREIIPEYRAWLDEIGL